MHGSVQETSLQVRRWSDLSKRSIMCHSDRRESKREPLHFLCQSVRDASRSIWEHGPTEADSHSPGSLKSVDDAGGSPTGTVPAAE
jgi:hypothetical protein